MILHLHRDGGRLAFRGDAFGRPLPEEELAHAVRFLYSGWRAPVLEGRGVLHALWAIHRGAAEPFVHYAPEVLEASELLPLVLRVVAAGRVVPAIVDGEARWRAVCLPEECDAERFHLLVDQWMRTAASTPLTRAQTRKCAALVAEDAWLNALRSPQPALPLQDATFAASLLPWSEPLYEGGRNALPLRPGRTDAGWRLEVTQRSPEALRLLGQAIAIAPTLAFPQPWSDAHFARILREAIPALRAAAFTVELPAELENTVPTLTETAVALEGEQVRVERTVEVAGTVLSEAEAQAILDAGESLTYVHGVWRAIDLDALRQALERLGPPLLPKRRALPLLLSGAMRPSPDAQDVQNFLRAFGEPQEDVELPLREVLRPYQAQGICWLLRAAKHGLGVCLADDMGLGKTLQTIAFLLSRQSPALVVAPLTVLPVWERELARWAPHLRVYRHDGPERIGGLGFAKVAEAADVTLTAYNYLWRDYATLRRVAWQTLVLDEAQFIKNPATQQAQAARALPAAFRLALTGTPLENRLDDLWSLLDFLNPGLFGPRREFAERYASPAKLRRAVAWFLLRRLKTDPAIRAELPPKIEQDHYAALTEAQAAAYDLALSEYARDACQRPEGGRTGAALVLLSRLRQICDGVEEGEAGFDSGKWLVLLPLLEEILAGGESVLIFTQFLFAGAALQRLVSERLGRPVPFVHGSLSAAERREQIAAFNRDSRPGVLILSLRTGAFGLTLTKASHVVHFDRWWNPAVEAQATDRVHRIGQTRTVVVHRLICRGTLEERIDRLLRDKQILADTIVAPTPAAILAKLPVGTLLNALRRDGALAARH